MPIVDAQSWDDNQPCFVCRCEITRKCVFEMTLYSSVTTVNRDTNRLRKIPPTESNRWYSHCRYIMKVTSFTCCVIHILPVVVRVDLKQAPYW